MTDDRHHDDRHHDDLHQLAAAYALDAIDADERLAFESHLATCAECRRDITDFAATASALASATPAVPPAPLKASVMAKIAKTPQQLPDAPRVVAGVGDTTVSSIALDDDLAERRRRRLAPVNLLAVAAAFVLIVVGFVAVSALRDRGADVDDVVAAPDAVVTALDGTDGSFRIVWSAELGRAAVFGNDLPDPGADSVYELWAIEGDVPVPSGLFVPVDGTVREVTEVDGSPAAWGVTIEPDGGSDAPTTEIIHFAEV
jgi:anti-sigma-K factor RskA